MSETPSQGPWLTIVGLGEDGPDGLPPASHAALDRAEIVMGAKRHLALLPDLKAETLEWPVPFADGLPMLAALRGQRVVVLASGNPFWFGAGAAIARRFDPEDWVAIPGPSTFSIAAARMGWSIEDTLCLGLHAAPLTRLRPHLATGRQAILLLRDGDVVADLARYLCGHGFGGSRMTVLEALGGPRERMTKMQANALREVGFTHPVAVAVAFKADRTVQILPRASGIDDVFFATDGQITKRPVRALALSALAPRPFERLWDIGGGSGSIGIEWLLSDPTTDAVSIEARPDRAARIRENAVRLGVERLHVVEGKAHEALEGLPPPDAVFIGGGLSEALISDLTTRLSPGTRIVAHAVTLESEALLTTLADRFGGSLLRIDLAEAAPLGSRRGWKAAYPIVQWQAAL